MTERRTEGTVSEINQEVEGIVDDGIVRKQESLAQLNTICKAMSDIRSRESENRPNNDSGVSPMQTESNLNNAK